MPLRYPNKEQQALFFKHYMADSNAAQLSPAELDKLSASANVWALASHLYWGIWAIIQVGSSRDGATASAGFRSELYTKCSR